MTKTIYVIIDIFSSNGLGQDISVYRYCYDSEEEAKKELVRLERAYNSYLHSYYIEQCELEIKE